MNVRGDVLVWLDPQGRLLEFSRVPPELEDLSRPPAVLDWAVVFREAGLDPAQWTSTPPRYLPASYADRRGAWTGVSPDRPQDQMRIEAAKHGGQLVSLKRFGPWSEAGPFLQAAQVSTADRFAGPVWLGLFVIAMVVGVLLARRTRTGRHRATGRRTSTASIGTPASWCGRMRATV